MSMSREQVSDLIVQATNALASHFQEQLTSITNALNRLQPASVQPMLPVAIREGVENGNSSLHLIKSLPEFKGDMKEYPAWREAAHFAIEYYVEGSENYYIAMGILRNKITGAANVNLAAFNTVLNFKAIIMRLDQSYSDKRPLHVLENELSILRQGNSSIKDFYDSVDKQLTLIINKNKMVNSSNQQVINALNDRARENALRVFISGLKRPLSDILFSSNPPDLPSALAIAEELEYNQYRQEFARAFHNSAAGNLRRHAPQFQNANKQFNIIPKPIMSPSMPQPMDVDPGSSVFKKNKFNSNRTNQCQQRPSDNNITERNLEQIQSIRHTPFSNRNIQNVHHLEGGTENQLPHENQSEICTCYSETESLDQEVNFLE